MIFIIAICCVLTFIMVWAGCGRAIFMYYLPNDTKRNRRMACISGALFGIVCTRFNSWLEGN